MIIYVDENMPTALAEGLHKLQGPLNAREGTDIEIKSIKAVFGTGCKDEEWIPAAGKEKACVITQDFNIQRQRHQRELYKQHGLGVFFLRPPSSAGFPYWDMVKVLVREWPQLVKIAVKENKPFAYQCTAKKSLEKI